MDSWAADCMRDRPKLCRGQNRSQPDSPGSSKIQRERYDMNASKILMASALAIAATCGVASAQTIPEGRVYTFHSKAQGACPALDWHVVVEANDKLAGMISWDDMKAMARASGTLNMQARTFTMQAHEVGGQGRTATVDGTVRQDGYLVANVKGPKVTCIGITVPWFVPPPGGSNG
jgi:hypothetical protein